MEKILIIGGTGKIGSAAVDHLHEHEADFLVLVRNREKQSALESRGIRCISGDYSDTTSLSAAMKEVQSLFLLVTPHYNMADHEAGIIQKAVENGVNYILKISAVGANPDGDTHLGRSHGISEQKLAASGMSYTVLRPHSFMQNTLGSLPTILDHGNIYGTLGDAAVPMVDARDIGDAAGRILRAPIDHIGKTYTLTGPQRITMTMVAESIGRVTGRAASYINVPDEAAKSSMMQAGLPEWLVDDLLTMNSHWRNGGDASLTKDLESLLGHPARTVDDFIRDHAFLFG